MGERNSMRRKLVIASILISMTGVITYAQTQYEFENREYFFLAYYDDLGSPPYRFSFFNELFYFDIPELDLHKLEEMQHIKGTIQGNYKVSESEKFVYINVKDKKYLVLYQDSLLCILIDCANNDTFFGINKNSKYVTNVRGRGGIYIGIRDDRVLSRKTSSFLIEVINGKEIAYNGLTAKYYLQVTKPWVEGVEGNGIGEWIEKEAVHDIRDIVVFNGYIDPNRPDLYYANSRVKEILISAGSNKWNYHIEDTPNPQVLSLPIPVSGTIRFTIQDVYEGNKYTDTCIGGIFFLREQGELQ
jgi:hypothetical protein